MLYAFPKSVAAWKEYELLTRYGLVLISLSWPLLLAEVNLQYSAFFDGHVEHRSRFGTKSHYRYEEIRRMIVDPDESITITFANGKIRVWALEADLTKLRDFLVQRIEALPDGREVFIADRT
jgi:hypothetical protein